MAIPKSEDLMLPLLIALSDREVWSFTALVDRIADDLQLSQDDRAEVTPKNKAPKFKTRLRFAQMWLDKAGLATKPQNGKVQITEDGSELIEKRPQTIEEKLLLTYPSYADWIDRINLPKSEIGDETDPDRFDPGLIREFFESAYDSPEVRRAALERLGESIRFADSIAPSSWATNFRRDQHSIRLNVGPAQALIFRRDEVLIVVDLDSPAALRVEQVTALPGVSVDAERYGSLASARTLHVNASSFHDIAKSLDEAHESLLRKFSTQRSKSTWWSHHWQAIPAFLRESGIDVPDPAYVESTDCNIWIFQVRHDKLILRDALVQSDDESVLLWRVRDFKGSISVGDRALLWQAVASRGFYAIAEVVSGPTSIPDNPNEEEVELRIERVFDPPLLTKGAEGDTLLSQNLLFKYGGNSEYRITQEQWDRVIELADGKIFPVSAKGSARPSIVEIATATNLATSDIEELQHLLDDKRQIILEGPPGSGKTFVADKLARFLTGNELTGDHDDHIEIVQFHQSYGYEDFVQGIRPATAEGGGLTYNVQPGIFLQLCRRARTNPDETYVLIIDEINRGNISRVFGELLMLLEYRDKKIRLPYGPCEGFEDGQLSIPDNLLIIGTMNSTDRSLAVIDYALRRRFYFYRLMPVVNGKAAALSSWLAQQEFTPTERDNIHNLFVALNAALRTHNLPEDFQIGHSYFMRADINTDAGRQRVWQWAIIPLVREYFHNARDEKMLDAFAIERLLRVEAEILTEVESADEAE